MFIYHIPGVYGRLVSGLGMVEPRSSCRPAALLGVHTETSVCVTLAVYESHAARSACGDGAVPDAWLAVSEPSGQP